jgi:hypothetical protein
VLLLAQAVMELAELVAPAVAVVVVSGVPSWQAASMVLETAAAAAAAVARVVPAVPAGAAAAHPMRYISSTMGQEVNLLNVVS